MIAASGQLRTSSAPLLALLLLAASAVSCERAAQADGMTWAGIKELVRMRFPAAPQLAVDDLVGRLGSGAPPPLLVDVREPEEYAVSHLPGAINAQGDAIAELIDQRGGGRDVVLYCSVGYRSSREAEKLVEKGYDRIFNLEGSIFEWANAGHPVVRDDSPTEQVHPFDDEWGQLLERELWSYGDNPRHREE